MIDLQGLADDLCEKLGRSIAIDNEHVEVIAASAQVGRIDPIRSDAILNRRTSAEVVEYVRELNLAQATKPTEVPPHPTLHTLPRWCFPIRTGARLLGFLWVINEPRLTDAEVDLAGTYAARVRDVLARNVEQADAILGSSIQFTNTLLVDGRSEALDEAGRAGRLISLGPATVWSFALSSAGASNNTVTTADVVELLADLLTTTRPGGFIGAPNEDRLVLVTRSRSRDQDHDTLLRAVQLSCRRTRLRLRAAGRTLLATKEDPREALSRSMFTALVARWDGQEEVREWEKLGAWTLLKGHPWSSELVRSISPSAHHLIQRGTPILWETLLAYLDSCCDARQACGALHIQRNTLYYRLGRVKEIAGDQILSSGWDQTSAHLALRVWRAHLRSSGLEEDPART